MVERFLLRNPLSPCCWFSEEADIALVLPIRPHNFLANLRIRLTQTGASGFNGNTTVLLAELRPDRITGWWMPTTVNPKATGFNNRPLIMLLVIQI